jgi:hypothetical protein
MNCSGVRCGLDATRFAKTGSDGGGGVDGDGDADELSAFARLRSTRLWLSILACSFQSGTSDPSDRFHSLEFIAQNHCAAEMSRPS